MKMNEKIKNFVTGSLFELVTAKLTREHIAEEITKQTEGMKGMSDIQKIVLGLISIEIQQGKESQAVAASKNIAQFIANIPFSKQ